MAKKEVVVEARRWQTGKWISMAAATIVVLCALPGATLAANSGEICFSGAIVAPQFEVSSTAVAINPPVSPTTRVGAHRAAVDVTFKAQPGVVSGGDIGLMVNDGVASHSGEAALETVKAHYIDAAGRRLSPRADGHYRVGASGGVLSLEQKDGEASAALRPMTVVITYD